MLAHFSIIKGCYSRLSYFNDKKTIQLAMRPAEMALSVLGRQRETGRIFQAVFSIESGGAVGHTHNNAHKSTPPPSNAFSGVQR